MRAAEEWRIDVSEARVARVVALRSVQIIKSGRRVIRLREPVRFLPLRYAREGVVVIDVSLPVVDRAPRIGADGGRGGNGNRRRDGRRRVLLRSEIRRVPLSLIHI